ncbi:MAG: gamma-glutamylcyclotransferase [Pseudomonadota bacterium]|nr:gamma-glutamylcyclotransferase [Pseudomonadota bacterium]
MVADANGDHWVFGYGSLMWRPGFPHLEHHRARVFGWHRRLCIWSWHHRGSPDRPGLVMGLDRGGTCIGVAYRVAAQDAAAVRAYLDERERVTPAYLATPVSLRLDDGRRLQALTYVADRTYPQYAGRISVETAVATVRHGVGHSGRNPDYVRETVSHLRRIGVHDGFMEAVLGGLDAAPGNTQTGD